MLRPVQPVLHYVLNYKKIVNELCINRDKPELHCDGKCYLMQLIDKKQSENPTSHQAIQMEFYPIGFVELMDLKFAPLNSFKTKTFTYQDKYTYLSIEAIDKPPQVLI